MNRRAITGLAVVAGTAGVLLWTLRPAPGPEAAPSPAAPEPPPLAPPRESPPEPPAGPRPLRGRLVDQEGNAVDGARLQLVELSAGAPPGPVESGPGGAFSFPPVPARDWTVRIAPPEPPAGRAWVERGPRRRVAADGRPVAIVLEHRAVAGPPVEVAVEDAATGAPLDPVACLFQPRDGLPLEWTLLSTRPLLREGGLTVAAAEPGLWRAWVRVADGRVAHADVPVGEGGAPATARVAVGGPGAVEGTVDLAGLSPEGIEGLEVRVGLAEGLSFPVFATAASGAQGEPTGAGPVDGEGAFRLAGLLPGRHRVSILRREASATAEVVVPPGGSARAALHPVPAAVLRLRVEEVPEGGFAFLTTIHERFGMQFAERRVADESGVVVVEVPFHPGRVRWRLSFGADPERGSLVELAPPAEGVAEAGPGELREVVVPFRR